MISYASLADDYFINVHLHTETELSGDRETVLHFCEQMQKRFPELHDFYAREKGEYVIESDKEQGQYRWCGVEPRRIASGYVNPETPEIAIEQHRHALDVAGYSMSISPLDCEALDLLVGFDFTYRGNHCQVVAEALGLPASFEKFAGAPTGKLIGYEPTVTLALDPDCRWQCRLSIENRTQPAQIRTGEYGEEQLSVYVTARRYGSLEPRQTFVDALDRLAKIGREMIEGYVARQVLEPLARTISLR